MTKYNVDQQYRAFLQRMCLADSPEVQAAFYGGCGWLINYVKGDLAGMKPMQRAAIQQSIEIQVDHFFEIELRLPDADGSLSDLPPISGEVHAPFTPEQVARINDYQQSSGHPILGNPQRDGRATTNTCPNGDCRMIATVEGLTCPCKAVKQTYVPVFITL